MTVFGATTAVVAATPYTPPYKYVTSYAPAPSVTGSITKPISNNPTVPDGTSSADYAWAYLSAHMMSWPSYRYIYLLWIVLAVIAVLYIISHQARLGASSTGAVLSKWAIRRQPIGKRRSGGARGRALASNGILLISAILLLIALILTFVGPDYIAPTLGVLSFRKRQFLSPGQIQYASPSYTIHKSIWTIASRLGDTAFALTPLTVLLAMKSPPVAILAWRGLAHLYSDKLATFHKVTAWMVWGATTAHVALWTVQLFLDRRNGSATWFAMWTNYRFIAGVVAYTALTGVMVASFRIVRQKQYEFFYVVHVVLVFLTIALSALHHPVLWFWMAAALGIWALERLFRLFRFWRINSGSSKSSSRRANNSTLLASQYEDLPQSDSYAMADLPSRTSYVDKTLPRPPGLSGLDSPGEWSPASTPRGSHSRGASGGYAEGSLQPLGAFDGRYSTAGSTAGSTGLNGGFNRITHPPASSTPALAPIPVGLALAQLLPSRTIRLTIHAGRLTKWAPGQNILLYLPDLSAIQSHPFTITNPPNSDGEIIVLVKARKGLTRQLYNIIRERYQYNMSVGAGSAGLRGRDEKGRGQGKEGVDVPPVLIRAKVDGPFGSAVRVRWGDHATVVIICGGSGVSFGVAVLEGVCKSIRERKGGKTRRIRFCWIAREYAEIAWVAHQLQRCQTLLPPAQLQIEIYITNSVPLPSHDLAPPRAAFAKSTPRASSPGSDHTLGRRSASMDSIASVASDMSIDSPMGMGYSDHLEVDEHLSENYADVIDLTNYEDEEDVADPREEALSSSVREQGKIRRARRRGMAQSRSAPMGFSGSQDQGIHHPPLRSGRSNLALSAYDQLEPAGSPGQGRRSFDHQPSPSPDARQPRPSTSYDASPRPSSSNPYAQPRPSSSLAPPPATLPVHQPQHSKRNSYASSYADSYAAYDPFSGGHGGIRANSPGSSMHGGYFGDDDRGSIAGDSMRPIHPNGPGGYGSGAESPGIGGFRASRTGSMVLLDEAAFGSNRLSQAAGAEAGGGGGSKGFKAAALGEGLWVDQADYEAMATLSEYAIAGKPALGTMLEEEIASAVGSLIVTTCGPTTLNTVVRNLVSKHISPSKIRNGDKSGHIAIYSEDYDA
ncbi:uncharacterized protein MKK02DRAFT_17105 [Dioszegia hungarica]|uniref:ferric-chelate reductase (NADPH) n=1 Tax=Dioszegia hungarica TaxID=4972 RepID=A0AA38LR03_9TREE|nr:uncharacterized protein MKK02DRAFT_17105 [Dioszegia hungarica]KAI9633732.1 hypothetical protein MKK02DRAFT_17105 [Dioszegia hungarica]